MSGSTTTSTPSTTVDLWSILEQETNNLTGSIPSPESYVLIAGAPQCGKSSLIASLPNLLSSSSSNSSNSSSSNKGTYNTVSCIAVEYRQNNYIHTSLCKEDMLALSIDKVYLTIS